jgi:hypothetical protein
VSGLVARSVDRLTVQPLVPPALRVDRDQFAAGALLTTLRRVHGSVAPA